MNASVSDHSGIEREASRRLAARDAGWDAASELEFARWCAADPRHRAAVAHLETAWRTLDQPRNRGEIAALRAVLQQRARRRWRRTAFGLASGAAVAAGLAVLFWPRMPAGVNPAPLVATARALIPEMRALPDGSLVDLLPGSTIEVDFSGEFRRVRLTAGEAHFTVTKDPIRPFVVSVGGIDVRAVGTAFVVRLEPGDVEVIVTEGRVAVTGSPAADDRESDAAAPLVAALDAGHRVVIAREPRSAPVLSPVAAGALDQRLAWRQRRLEFSDTTLAEAAALFNRTHPGRLRTADPVVAARRITGVFRADNLDGFVALLESTLDVRVERRGDGTIVLHAGR